LEKENKQQITTKKQVWLISWPPKRLKGNVVYLSNIICLVTRLRVHSNPQRCHITHSVPFVLYSHEWQLCYFISKQSDSRFVHCRK